MSKSVQTHTLLFAALFKERGVLATLVVAQVIATILAFAPTAADDIWIRLGVISLFLHLTFLSSLTWLYILRTHLLRLKHALQMSALMLSLLMTTAIFSGLLVEFASDFIVQQNNYEFILRNLLVVFLVTALFIQFLTIHFEKDQQTNALARAELDALQARIRPHFLYNSLNTAAELTHCDPQAAEQAILALAALSQAAMRVGKETALSDEITLTQQYLALERWRFAERLQVSWQLPEQLPDVTIPCLTLQPLLENAVCHGVEPSLSGATIYVELHVSKRSLVILVENPISAQQQKRPGNGMALDNIRQRLDLYYRGHAKLTMTTRDEIFRVKLVLPLTTNYTKEPV
ncbi:alginate biosynthesis protein [Pseudoalteromonas sp. S1727]|uniref:sensor histidine kinase n=1 Tax=Pseudoalteromonas sp. S1727 TaxID=2066514 RepID=UPI0011094858|nr:histidine kinase [Pseudoalteromonas sp. S1727]TMN71358.1 alginate biosynthesis protein [Pseudoalteromonas sp. S1727]